MAGNPLSSQLIDQMVANDANWLGGVLAQVERRIYQWQVNCGNTSAMAAVGYTNTSNQAQVVQLINNLVAINQVMTGTMTASWTRDMRPDLAALQGIN